MKPRNDFPSRSVPCPYCGVPTGRLCVTRTGNTSHESHGMRRDRARLAGVIGNAFQVPVELLTQGGVEFVSPRFSDDQRALIRNMILMAAEYRLRNRLGREHPIQLTIPRGAEDLWSEPIEQIMNMNKIYICDPEVEDDH